MKSVLGNTVLAILVVLAVALLPAKAMDHGQMSSHAHSHAQANADAAGAPGAATSSDHHAGGHKAHLVDVTGGAPAMGDCPANPDHGSDCCTTNCVSLMSVSHPSTGMVPAPVLHDAQVAVTFYGNGAAILDRPPRS
jgi:hypothetical protein